MEYLQEIRKKYSNVKQISEEIYQTLRCAMIDNVLHSGDRLVETVLASQFGVSRAPIREAIKRLEIDGFVTYDQKYGFQVKTFSFVECYENSEALEYIHRVTTLMAAEKITPVNIMRLRDNIAKLCALPPSDTIEIGKLLENFHGIIVQSVNNESLFQIYETLHQKFIFILNRHKPSEIDMNTAEQHRQICDSLEMHNEKLAWELSLEHSKRALAIRAKRFLG